MSTFANQCQGFSQAREPFKAMRYIKLCAIWGKTANMLHQLRIETRTGADQLVLGNRCALFSAVNLQFEAAVALSCVCCEPTRQCIKQGLFAGGLVHRVITAGLDKLPGNNICPSVPQRKQTGFRHDLALELFQYGVCFETGQGNLVQRYIEMQQPRRASSPATDSKLASTNPVTFKPASPAIPSNRLNWDLVMADGTAITMDSASINVVLIASSCAKAISAWCRMPLVAFGIGSVFRFCQK